MAAVDKVWEAEYSDINTDLDSILDEASLDLLPSGSEINEADSFVVEEEISEDIFDEDVQVKEDRGAAIPGEGGGIKRVLTLFKSNK